MALSGIHTLLTYKCDRACDHCFVYAAPGAPGTFTFARVRALLEELPRLGTITKVFFEGGEPFLFYQIMRAGIALATELGFDTGIVTNAYWATTEEDAGLWLEPLAAAGLTNLVVSRDELHSGTAPDSRADNAVSVAESLGIATSVISTDKPCIVAADDGTESVSGGVAFRGRAAESYADDLPTEPPETFTECPAEDLRNPGRVHVDAYGNVHLCQGLLMGNAWRTPMSELVASYDPDSHPIAGPMLRGGPARLAEEHGVQPREAYVSACHMCYLVRRALIDLFPEYLGPRQVYGLE
jgi:hypothetical protein